MKNISFEPWELKLPWVQRYQFFLKNGLTKEQCRTFKNNKNNSLETHQKWADNKNMVIDIRKNFDNAVENLVEKCCESITEFDNLVALLRSQKPAEQDSELFSDELKKHYLSAIHFQQEMSAKPFLAKQAKDKAGLRFDQVKNSFQQRYQNWQQQEIQILQEILAKVAQEENKLLEQSKNLQIIINRFKGEINQINSKLVSSENQPLIAPPAPLNLNELRKNKSLASSQAKDPESLAQAIMEKQDLIKNLKEKTALQNQELQKLEAQKKSLSKALEEKIRQEEPAASVVFLEDTPNKVALAQDLPPSPPPPPPVQMAPAEPKEKTEKSAVLNTHKEEEDLNALLRSRLQSRREDLEDEEEEEWDAEENNSIELESPVQSQQKQAVLNKYLVTSPIELSPEVIKEDSIRIESEVCQKLPEVPDNFKNNSQSKLASLKKEDPFLAGLINDLPKSRVLDDNLIQDLVILREFINKKLSAQHVPAKELANYQNSLQQFYEAAVSIRLSDSTAQEQLTLLKKAAHQHFHHRHNIRRWFADGALVLSSLCLVGLPVLLGHKLLTQSHTFFFNTAKTNREIEFRELIKKDSSASLFKNS